MTEQADEKNKKENSKAWDNYKKSLLAEFKAVFPEITLIPAGVKGQEETIVIPEPPRPQEKVIADFQKIAEEKAKKEAEAKARAEEEERLRKIEELQSQIEKIRSKVNK
jgi:hypothetical protein